MWQSIIEVSTECESKLLSEWFVSQFDSTAYKKRGHYVHMALNEVIYETVHENPL